jgi:undecaprenol kinase
MSILYDLKKVPKSTMFALHGLRHAYKSDKSFRMEVTYGFPIFVIIGWYLAPFAAWEILLYVFSYLLILIVELVNTAFESTLDHLHPDKHDKVAATKDIASAAVFLAFVFAALVTVVLWYTRNSADVDSVSIMRVFV